MKMKNAKHFAVMMLMATTTTIASAYDRTTINDLPNPILSCQESHGGATVLDGAKQLTVGRDQFGQFTLTLIQKDPYSGDSVLVRGLPLNKEECRGYAPCELYTGRDARQGAVRFFINLLPNSTLQGGHLDAKIMGVLRSVEFVCRKI
jgi:hypothetical protein